MKKTKIINLFGGPGAGKSTLASGLFYELNKRGIDCDIPYEFPKELAWNDSTSLIKDQFYVISNQHRGIVRSYGKVDYIILDSPIPLSLIYKTNYTEEYPASLYGNTFDDFIIELFNSYENINFLIKRTVNEFKDTGRFHDKNESVKIDNEILQLLMKNKITFSNLDIDYDDPIKKILKVLGIK